MKQFTELQRFNLNNDFIKKYEGINPFKDDLSYVTYKRTYSRIKSDGTNEEWVDTVRRVVEGVYTVQKTHCLHSHLVWKEDKAQASAEKMFDLIFNFKFTPPGRGLWMMGTDYVYERGGACLNNCAFVSTENLEHDFSEPFTFLMDMSMVGVGVGADTKGAGTVTIQQPEGTEEKYVIPDTREGWVKALEILLLSYVGKEKKVEYDFSNIRPLGDKIRGFGGVASGPGPLKEMLREISVVLDNRIGQEITSGDIVDIFNLIGKCVVAGNVRRTAEIMFGDPNDQEFLELKNPEKHQDKLFNHRWASNNSVFADVGMDYSKVAEMTAKNGEPGYEWLQNARQYSRMDGDPDFKDYRAGGGNPCLEQTLESYELCCLVETFPSNHTTLNGWIETLKYAYLYAKTVSLIMTHNNRTNQVISRNRRIGCSMSGITQAFTKFGRRNMFEFMKMGYEYIEELDESYSEWLGIPLSIKKTSVKPSGTVSLLASVTSGVHYPYAEYYYKNMRMSKIHSLIPILKDAGYPIHEDPYDKSSYVVSFPVKVDNFDRAASDVSMWEQLENVAQIQQCWADNQVSVTISFKPEEASDIKNALELYETRLKGVSFLPYSEHSYELPPYQPITAEEYEKTMSKIKTLDINSSLQTQDQTDKFCDGEACQI